MLVSNDVRHDARVQREATTLSSRYRVTVFGLDRGTPYERDNGFQVRLIHVPARELRHRPGGLLAAYLQFAARAVASIRRHRPDVLHAHDLDALIPSAIVAARLKVPLIYDAHELYAEQSGRGPAARRFLRTLEDIAMRHADAIIAANESRADVMWHEYRTPMRPVVVLNCPMARHERIVSDGRLRRYVADHGRRWDRIVIYQGGFPDDRHLRELARAAAGLPLNAGVVFVGAGPAADVVRSEGRDRVLLHPLVAVDELLPFIADGDVGVVTYANTCRNNYLCAPNKLFDYAQVGMPIAVGDLPELVRIVATFDAGVVFKNGDPDSMAHEITALLTDEARLRRARDGACRLARHFTWDGEAAKLLDVYDRVLGRSDLGC